ncbi:hypothetical protein CGCF413_v006460 [Colletotrichum fructicola]|nr:hypothetical protein CGCF413_v006460 [Colletotrichum fructicola]
MAKGLHFISTKVHPSTRLVGLGSTKHAPIVELVIFLSREPTPDLERWIRNKTATLFEISDQIFVRCTIITLGREQNPANLSGRLRNLLIEELPKTLSIFNKKRMRRFCIFADEITTHVVKDMMIYHHGELWQQIACLIFEHTQQGTENEVITKAFSDVARLENNGRLFDRLFVDDSQIPQSVTWVVKVPRSRRDDYKAVLSAAFDKFRHASKHLIDDASSSDIVDRAQPALPPQATDCQVQNYALFRKSHKSAAATESGTDEIIEHAFTENDSKAQHKHSVNINGRRNSRREDYLSGERWSDPKQGVEEHATVQVDEMGTILDDIDKRLHTMSQMDKVNMHRSLHGTKLLVSQSSLQLLSGNWMAAKTALNQQLQDIREAQRTYTPDPDRLRAVGEDASYWLAEILIRIGEYTKAAELLDMVTPKWNLGQANPRHQHHNRTEVIRSVHLLRLQALCGANLELGSNIVDEQLQRAQASLGYFHNSDASSFKQFDNEPLDYQVAQLLTDFTISKILSVRGNYKEALKLMMTTTAQAIQSAKAES